MIDWPGLLNTYRIPYITEGPSVRRGEIGVRCPWCGTADPSYHLGINPAMGAYACWRNRAHAGRRPARLIQALLRCSWARACELAGERLLDLSDDRMEMALRALSPAVPHRPLLSLPAEFMRIEDKLSARPYINYILNRGFDRAQVLRLTDDYGLRYCTDGPFHGRIIFPVYHEGRLVSWTGRTVSRRDVVRYKSLDVATSGAPISSYLLWFDELTRGGRVLVLVEGPFDALKVRTLGQRFGVQATCCFTASPSRAQVNLLHALAPAFERRVVLLDEGTTGTALRVSAQLAALDFEPLRLPDGVKDPGELDRRSFGRLLALVA